MKIYSFNGETFSRLPNLLKTPDGTVSPVSEALFLQLGGTIEEDEEPAPEEDFRAACAMFRALCDEIGQFIGDASFQGGFDGYADFAESEAYRKDPVRGNALAKYFPSWLGYNMAKCGGCIRACVRMLEKKGGCLAGRFQNPLRTGKAWKMER